MTTSNIVILVVGLGYLIGIVIVCLFIPFDRRDYMQSRKSEVIHQIAELETPTQNLQRSSEHTQRLGEATIKSSSDSNHSRKHSLFYPPVPIRNHLTGPSSGLFAIKRYIALFPGGSLSSHERQVRFYREFVEQVSAIQRLHEKERLSRAKKAAAYFHRVFRPFLRDKDRILKEFSTIAHVHSSEFALECDYRCVIISVLPIAYFFPKIIYVSEMRAKVRIIHLVRYFLSADEQILGPVGTFIKRNNPQLAITR